MALDPPISEQLLDIDLSYAWTGWEKKKGKSSLPRIARLIQRDVSGMLRQSLTSNMYSAVTPESLSLHLESVGLSDNERRVESQVDRNGVLVLRPTPLQYGYFAELLEMIERCTGFEQGVAKIIVPQDR